MYSGVLGGVMCRQPLQWTKPETISRYHRCDNAIYAYIDILRKTLATIEPQPLYKVLPHHLPGRFSEPYRRVV